MEERKETTSSGRIIPRSGINDRIPYDHQKRAMECMDRINSGSDFSTLVVLPTGGGKTYTAALWLLHNAIDQHKKILWIAHRQMLLDQAAEAFQRYAYTETIPHISGFRYRIISGSSSHGRTIDIRRDDDLLIVSKDSIGRSLSALDDWLAGEEELFLVVDEAHHSTAKTYRRVIDYVRSKIPHVKLIGLTATPFRTAEDEQGLLGKIYTDGVKNNAVVHNDVGITYQISLKDLISRRILAKPVFESYQTEEQYGQELGLEACLTQLEGKRTILNALLAGYNDGRRKTFLHTAVYLLPPGELQSVMADLDSRPELAGQPIKERALVAVELLQQAADRRGISLKLNKKAK